MSAQVRPLGVLVAALGGEGGGVLTDWIVSAALAADLPVQSTSIPGVAQRTGATTYYIEVFPQTNAALGGRRPVFGLYPVPGDVDAMIASELVEAGRAVENGFITPDRTTLIASTHRVYATVEKIAMGDGRIDAARILEAVAQMAQRPILFDLTQDRARRALPLNAVLLGALAGSGVLPIAEEHFTAAIRAAGIAVEANLAGFVAGAAIARGSAPASAAPEAPPARPASPFAAAAQALAADLGSELVGLIAEAADRLADYQDRAHAESYLASLGRVAALDRPPHVLTAEVARRLALWMSYEDVIRVADLKTRAERFAEIRAEVRAKPDEPVVVTEHLKPGVDEIAAILPAWLGRPIHRFAERRGLLDRWQVSMRVTSSGAFGFLKLWLVGRLRSWRPRSFRFAEETALQRRWLDAIVAAAPRDPALAFEIAGCARLLKGYGDTQRRGRRNFLAIFERVVAPALAGGIADGAARVKAARTAALADPEGKALAGLLDAPAPAAARLAAE